MKKVILLSFVILLSGVAVSFAANTYFEDNVGIGIEEPAQKLHVVGSGAITGSLGVRMAEKLAFLPAYT